MIENSKSATNSAYFVRPCREDDINDVLHLLRLTLSNSGASTKSSENWNWKHSQSPAGKSLVLVAESVESKDVIGVRALMFFDASNNKGERVKLARPVDTATHPNWGRLGIFKNLTLSAVSALPAMGVHRIFNTPNSNSLPGYLKMGWDLKQRPAIYGRSFTFQQLLAPILTSRARTRRRDTSISFEINSILQMERRSLEAVASFCEDAETRRAVNGLRILRTRATLTWRYSHPSANYFCFIVRDAVQTNCILGVVFYRIENRKGIPICLFTDYFSSENFSFENLILKAMREIRKPFYVAASGHTSSEFDSLKNLGFFRCREMNLAGRLANPSSSELDFEEIDYTLSDLELF